MLTSVSATFDFPLPADLHPQHRRELIEGPVRGCRLYRDGYLVLHGSAVLVRNACISIVGPSGHGKSTLAAALCVRGGKLVSDGMTPVDLTNGCVQPGPSRTKLSEQSIGLLGLNADAFTPIHPTSPKYYVPIEGVADTGDIELAAVICVDEGDQLALTRLQGAAAAFRLLSNAYLIGHLPKDFDVELFRRAAALADRVPVFVLTRQKVPEQLNRTVEYIEEFVETQLRRGAHDAPHASAAGSR